jgi:uncharacterized protein YcbX
MKAPGMEPLYIPLVPQYPLEKVENVTCWEWSGTALSEGVEAAEWLSKFVGKPASLVRFDTGRGTLAPLLFGYLQGYILRKG